MLAQYSRACLLLAHQALRLGDLQGAAGHLKQAQQPPASLSEARHLLANTGQLDYWMGVTAKAEGDMAEAERWIERAARSGTDFQQMRVQSVSENTLWSVLALKELGRLDEATQRILQMEEHAQRLLQTEPEIDYFATSLPELLLFEENGRERRDHFARLLQAQAALGRGGGDIAGV